MSLDPATPVWRYMSFGKFVWMLQHKQLWLTNATLLDDKWELDAPGAATQLQH